MLTPLLFLSIAAACPPANASAIQDGASVASAAQDGGDELQRLRQELLQPGPEARLRRENAVDTLLAKKAPAAHALLQEMLGRLADADGVSRTILIQLQRKLSNPQDPVFGDGDHGGALARSYFGAVSRFFVPEHGSDAVRALREEARQCLGALSHLNRRQAFEELLAAGTDPAVRVAALYGAAQCRDLGLAPLIAERIEDPTLGAAAQDALTELTFLEPFPSKQAFTEWWQANPHRTYLELVETAARRGREADRQAQRRWEQRTAELVAELVEAWATRPDVPWSQIATRVLRDDPRGSQRLALQRLRRVLGAERRTGGDAGERLALLGKLQEQFAAAPVADVELRALLLEVGAYLVAADEAQAAEAVTAQLRAQLGDPAAEVRRAALAGLRRFPSAAVMREVVEAARRAHAAGHTEVLAAALATLAAPGWGPPAADGPQQPWLDLLGGVVRDEAASGPVRESALAVLDVRDASGLPLAEAFPLLAEVAGSDRQPAVNRERAMVMLAGHAGIDEARADRYVRLMTTLLADPERRLRLKAAQLLQSVPRHRGSQEEWRRLVLESAGARLAEEPDEGVLRALVAAVERQVDEDRPDRGPVLARLRLALEAMCKAQVNGARRQILVGAVATQAASQGLDPMLWIRAGETLLQAGERREVRNLINRQRPFELVDRAGVPAEVVGAAMELVIETALLKPADVPWRECADEAAEVLRALERDGPRRLAGIPARRLLQVEVLAGLRQSDRVLELAKRYLEGADPLEEPLRTRVQILALRAHLERADVDAAARLLEGGLPHADPTTVAQLQEEVGTQFLNTGSPARAESLLIDALAATPEAEPAYRTRLLSLLEAQLRARPDQSRAILNRLLDKKALFEAADVPPPVRQRYDVLRSRLGDAGGG